jgi:hypothetical protein
MATIFYERDTNTSALKRLPGVLRSEEADDFMKSSEAEPTIELGAMIRRLRIRERNQL